MFRMSSCWWIARFVLAPLRLTMVRSFFPRPASPCRRLLCDRSRVHGLRLPRATRSLPLLQFFLSFPFSQSELLPAPLVQHFLFSRPVFLFRLCVFRPPRLPAPSSSTSLRRAPNR